MLYTEIRPRFTSGSPGLVDANLARRVARQEIKSYEAHKTGIYGDDMRVFAEKTGLGGIMIHYTLANSRFRIMDGITEEEIVRDTFVPRGASSVLELSPADATRGRMVRSYRMNGDVLPVCFEVMHTASNADMRDIGILGTLSVSIGYDVWYVKTGLGIQIPFHVSELVLSGRF